MLASGSVNGPARPLGLNRFKRPPPKAAAGPPEQVAHRTPRESSQAPTLAQSHRNATSAVDRAGDSDHSSSSDEAYDDDGSVEDDAMIEEMQRSTGLEYDEVRRLLAAYKKQQAAPAVPKSKPRVMLRIRGSRSRRAG